VFERGVHKRVFGVESTAARFTGVQIAMVAPKIGIA
jgi:hypothetical protein